jgi:hypothetical protein
MFDAVHGSRLLSRPNRESRIAEDPCQHEITTKLWLLVTSCWLDFSLYRCLPMDHFQERSEQRTGADRSLDFLHCSFSGAAFLVYGSRRLQEKTLGPATSAHFGGAVTANVLTGGSLLVVVHA